MLLPCAGWVPCYSGYLCLCSVWKQEENAGSVEGLVTATLPAPWGYLMASQGSRDIFTVYLIEEFAGRMFLALHE